MPRGVQSIAKSLCLRANEMTYSTTRFTSSAYKIFHKLYGSYKALMKTFEMIREKSDKEEEMK